MTQQLAYPNTVRDLVLEYRRKADALPAGSFRESGTNVNTGIFIWRKALQR